MRVHSADQCVISSSTHKEGFNMFKVQPDPLGLLNNIAVENEVYFWN